VIPMADIINGGVGVNADPRRGIANSRRTHRTCSTSRW
jgi:hypothetical protein